MLSAKQAGAGAGVVAKVENPAKNSKRITDWIKSIGNLQKVKIAVLLGVPVLVTPTGTMHDSGVIPKADTQLSLQTLLSTCELLRM